MKETNSPCNSKWCVKYILNSSVSESNNASKSIQRLRCSVETCSNRAVGNGYCIRHGGGRRCLVLDCTNGAKEFGFCWKHGGSKRCSVDGCLNRMKARGVCWTHGGGKRCSIDDCNLTSLSGGRCWGHGGGRRCTMIGCSRPGYVRNGGACDRHTLEYLCIN